MRKYPAIGLHFSFLFFSFLYTETDKSISVEFVDTNNFSFSFEHDKPKNNQLLNNQNAILSTDCFHRFPSNPFFDEYRNEYDFLQISIVDLRLGRRFHRKVDLSVEQWRILDGGKILFVL